MKKTYEELQEIAIELDRLTQSGDRTEAYVLAAKFMGNPYYIKIFKAIKVCHDVEGGLSDHLARYRIEVGTHFVKYCESELGENYKLICYNFGE